MGPGVSSMEEQAVNLGFSEEIGREAAQCWASLSPHDYSQTGEPCSLGEKPRADCLQDVEGPGV